VPIYTHAEQVRKVDEHVAGLRFLAAHVETYSNDMLNVATLGKGVLIRQCQMPLCCCYDRVGERKWLLVIA
jgi:hypothetical protein